MKNLFRISIVIISLIIYNHSFSCDFTTNDPVIIYPDGNHNSSNGFVQLYILTDINGNIVSVSNDGNFGVQNFGEYHAYAINYDNNNAPFIPTLGDNISALNSGCFDLSSPLMITVCNTSVDSVCVTDESDIVIAMNPDYNMDINYEQYIVIVDDLTGMIVSIKPLNSNTGSVNFSVGLSSGDLQVGNYSVYTLNFINTETLLTLGVVIGNNWTGNFAGACADVSVPYPVKVELCCDVITFNSNISNVTCFGEQNGSIEITNELGGTSPYLYSIDGVTYQNQNTFSNLDPGVFYITIKDSVGCVSLDSVVVSQPQKISFSSIVDSVSCYGLNDGQIVSIVSGGNYPYSYQWSSSSNTDSIQTNLPAGTVNLFIVDNNLCQLDTFVEVFEPDSFFVDILIVDSLKCNGDNNAVLSALVSPNPNNYNYEWLFPNLTNLNTSIVNNAVKGVYQVVATNIFTGCKDTNDIEVLEPEPILLTLDSNQTICISQQADLTASATGGTPPLTYHWNNGLSNQNSQTVSPLLTTEYFLYVEDFKGCFSDTLNAIITVRDSLHLEVSEDLEICQGESVDVSSVVSGGDGNYTYSWSNGFNSASFSDQPMSNINYVVNVTDGCGSPSVSASVSIIVNQTPSSAFSQVYYEGCSPLSVVYKSNLSNSSFSYQWTLEDGTILSNIDSLVHQFSQPGCNSIILSVNNGKCSSSTKLDNAFCVFENPNAQFDYIINKDDFFNTSADFSNLSLLNDSNQWFIDGVFFSNEFEPIFDFLETDSIINSSICLEVKTINGCFDEYCDSITIKPNNSFYVPNTFTPNGDYKNDIFMPVLYGYSKDNYQFMVFNRWGEKIFETNNIEEGWDGYYKGVLVQQDVYVWKIKAQKINTKEREEYLGHVNVLK